MNMEKEQIILDKLQDLDNIVVKQWKAIDFLMTKVKEQELQIEALKLDTTSYWEIIEDNEALELRTR